MLRLARPATLQSVRWMSSGGPVKTAIVMLNMGGPRDLNQVEPFLRRLFLDDDIIKLPMQSWLGPLIARRRAPKVAQKYAEIGGASPIHHWTHRQGSLVTARLDQISPQTAPHRYYIGFRYTEPSLPTALQQIEQDGVSRVVAVSQYPQYCCNTSGSSLNEMARLLAPRTSSMGFRLSFVDRWPTNPGLVQTFRKLIQAELERFDLGKSSVLILFTAHSLPLRSVNAGDPYPMEVSATVMAVMDALGHRFPFRLVWQSKVGPLPWQAPATPDAIKGYVNKGYKNILLVPISFVNEHIETLHELDIEYCAELCSTLPIETIRRCPAPNDHPDFIDGLAEQISQHLASGPDVPEQLMAPCPLCEKPVCRQTRQWLEQLRRRQS